MEKTFRSFALVGMTLFFAAAAQAQTPAFTFSNTEARFGLGSDFPYTLGYSFRANSTFIVDALGVFDSQQTGLLESHPVGLFDLAGNTLATGLVDSGDAVPLVNQFRYASISPVTLQAGRTYLIGAFYAKNSEDSFFFPFGASGDHIENFASDPRVTFGVFAYNAPETTLHAPTTLGDAQGGYSGPNFLISAAPAAAPEPGSLALLLCSGLFAVRALRRKDALRNK